MIDNEVQKKRFDQHYAALKSGKPDEHPEAFTNLRGRLLGKIGEPILVASKDLHSIEIGILRSDKPLFRDLELGFHTGPVAKSWKREFKDKEGPLWFGQAWTLVETLFALGIEGMTMGEPPWLAIGTDDVECFRIKSGRADMISAMIKLSSAEDADIYGRTNERERLAQRMRKIDKEYEPSFGGGPDAIDDPALYAIVGEMALCLRRAAQLDYTDPYVEMFKGYLKP